MQSHDTSQFRGHSADRFHEFADRLDAALLDVRIGLDTAGGREPLQGLNRLRGAADLGITDVAGRRSRRRRSVKFCRSGEEADCAFLVVHISGSYHASD